MADDSEGEPSTKPNVASTTASIIGTLNQLKKWRKVQLAECQEKQLIESQKLLQMHTVNQKQCEKFIESGTKHEHSDQEIKIKSKTNIPELSDVSSVSLVNDFDICDTLQDSSITGHLKRCFNDSTNSNVDANTNIQGNKVQHVPEKVPVFSELRNPQFSDKNIPLAKFDVTNVTTKPKRPFLKKGSGLLRFRAKSTSSSQISIDKDPPKVNKVSVKKFLPQKTLNLKPALRKPDVSSEKVKHIRFDITDSNDEDIRTEVHNDMQSEIPKSEIGTDISIHEEEREKPSTSASSIAPENNKFFSTVFGSESFNMSEGSGDLEEFEMLENYAQNSSFNSDCSLVQRVIQGESVKPSSAKENYSSMSSQNETSSNNNIHVSTMKNVSCPEIVGLNKCLEEIGAQKQKLNEVISDINPRIESLEKEISCDKKKYLEEDDISDRCSTPVNFQEDNPILECNSNFGSSVFEASPEVQLNHFTNDAGELTDPYDCSCCDVGDACDEFYQTHEHAQACSNKEECTCNCPEENYENEPDCDVKSKIHIKLLELQKEIEIYQQLNAKLSAVCKEKDNIVRKLQKDRDDFDKYKEAELQKLNAYIREEHQQIRRQKETFNRYQKLRKDNPTKKERDELSSLRSEIEKLHEELKTQKIKYNNDTRRLKTRLEKAENERDCFKLENIKLEEQKQDLLDTLKVRMKKNYKHFNDECKDILNDDKTKHTVEKRDAECQTEEKDLGFNMFQGPRQSSSNSADVKKSEKRSGLVSEFEENDIAVIDKDLNFQDRIASKNDNFHPDQNDLNNKSCDINRINIEKNPTNVSFSGISVSCDGELKEINYGNSIEKIYPSGEKEIIHKSGTRKFISADGKFKKVYFHNGDIKEMYSDGQIIYTYRNGIVETRLPDNTKITKYPNGQIQRSNPNGEKEIKFSDGTIHNILPNGSEEIRTADGKIVKNLADGTKVIELTNGLKEIITSTFKKREFPNGSIRIYYNDGKQETRYNNGRIKIKDKEGKIIIDTKYLNPQSC